MSTKIEATIEDLYKVEAKAELVNGEIVLMPLTGGLPHLAALRITLSLAAYEKTTGRGYAIADSAAFVVDLPHRKSFSPDAAYYIGEITMKFFQGAPVFAVRFAAKATMDQVPNGAWQRNALTTLPQVHWLFGTLIC